VSRIVCIALGGLWGLTSGAMAQAERPEVAFDRGRDVSVQQCARLEHGFRIRNGAFAVCPSLGLQIEQTDNVFSTRSDKRSDVITTFKPGVRLGSSWSRHALTGDASATRRQYSNFSGESVWHYTVGADSRVDINGDAKLTGGLRYSDLTEPRNAAGAAARVVDPIEYDRWEVRVGAERAVRRIRLQGDYRFSAFDYHDGVLVAGGVAGQDFRDRDRHILTGRVDFAISPDTRFFARVRHNQRVYDLKPPATRVERGSDGLTLDAGANFKLGEVAQGEVGIGYISQKYKSASLSDIEGLSIDGNVKWSPTRLTTVTFRANREVRESAVENSGGYLFTSTGVDVNHQWRRNVTLSGGLTLGGSDYQNINRTDRRLSVTTAVAYSLNRFAAIRGFYTYEDQESQELGGVGDDQDYSRNMLGVGLILHR